MADEFDDIRGAIRRRFGAKAEIDNVMVPTLGGINRTVIFDLVQGNARRRLVSRQETMQAEDSPFLPAPDQFRVMQVAYRHGVPVPEPILRYDEQDGMGSGYITAFVSGETIPAKIFKLPDFAALRPTLTRQLAEILARLHAIPAEELDFLKERPDSVDPFATYRGMYDSYAEAHPAIEIGFRWLERNRPAEWPKVPVHGDFRTGNFMVGPEGVTAVLDWECPHLGAGMEDLGWLCTRSWRFGQFDHPVGGIGLREPFYAAYEAASGKRVDPDEVRFWEVFGLVRWTVYCMMTAYAHVFRGRRGVAYAAMGRNTSHIEYELLMTLLGKFQ